MKGEPMGYTIRLRKLIKTYFKDHDEGSTEGITEWINNTPTTNRTQRRRTTNSRTVANILRSDPAYELKERTYVEEHGRANYVTLWVKK